MRGWERERTGVNVCEREGGLVSMYVRGRKRPLCNTMKAVLSLVIV